MIKRKTKLATFIIDADVWGLGIALSRNILYDHKYETSIEIVFLCFVVEVVLWRKDAPRG